MGALRARVVDDDQLYRRGLVGLLEPDLSMAIVGEGCHGGEATSSPSSSAPTWSETSRLARISPETRGTELSWAVPRLPR